MSLPRRNTNHTSNMGNRHEPSDYDEEKLLKKYHQKRQRQSMPDMDDYAMPGVDEMTTSSPRRATSRQQPNHNTTRQKTTHRTTEQRPRPARKVHRFDSSSDMPDTRQTGSDIKQKRHDNPRNVPQQNKRARQNDHASRRNVTNRTASSNHDNTARDAYGRERYNSMGYEIQWYSGYPGTDYPKGMGHGPVARVVNRKTGKTVEINGVPWEELPEVTQEDLDEQPYDDTGILRIFYRDDSGTLIEYGSEEHGRKIKSDLRDKMAAIRNVESGILSYKARPQHDKGADYITHYDPHGEDGMR